MTAQKILDSTKAEALCCYLGCESAAEWRIDTDKPYTETLACTAHVGELLSDAPVHYVSPMAKEVANGR